LWSCFAALALVAGSLTAEELVPNGGFEAGGAGDPWVPTGWHNGAGALAFGAGEVAASAAAPLAGGRSLELNTMAGPARKRLLYTRITLPDYLCCTVSYRARHLAGGNVVIMLRREPDKGPTSFLEAGRIGPGRRKDLYTGSHWLDDRSMYLVVYAREPAHVLIDEISVKPREWSRGSNAQRLAWAPEHWHTVNGEVTTPHVRWARPLAGGELRVLSFAQRWQQRWVVELAQRFSVTYDTVMFEKPHEEGANYSYWIEDEDGDPRYLDQHADALQKTDAAPACIVIYSLTAKAVSPRLAEAVLEQVRKGAGLVIHARDREYHRLPWGKALKVANSVELATEINRGQVALEEGRPADLSLDEGGAARFTGTGISYVTLGPVSAPDAAFYRYGKGRIVLVPQARAAGADREAFEFEAAHLMKAMLWAAARVPATRFAGVDLPGRFDGPLRRRIDHGALPAEAAFEFVRADDATGQLAVRWWIQDAYGERLHEGTITCPGDASRAAFALPRIKAGRHTLNAQLGDGDSVHDWTTVALEVASPQTITGISLLRAPDQAPYYTRGEHITGNVQFGSPLAKDQRVRVLLQDREGHLWQRHACGEDGRFTLRTGHTVALVHVLRAQVVDGEDVVSEREKEVMIIPAPRWYASRFDSQMWSLSDYGGYTGSLVHSVCRDLGVTSSFGGSELGLGGARVAALHGIRSVAPGGARFPGALNKVARDKQGAPIREPCLSDPDYLAWVAADIDLRPVPYAPLAYRTDHEQNLQGCTDRIADGSDLCFSRTCLAEFQDLLQQEYAGLDALNAAWGTSFGKWRDVRPLTLKTAVQRQQIPRWIDHRRSMDRVWTAFTRAKLGAVRRVDPLAQGVADNVRDSLWSRHNSYGGIDHWLLMRDVIAGASLVAPYLTAFTPPERRHLVMSRSAAWHGYTWTGDFALLQQRFGETPWEALLTGHRGHTYWFGAFPKPREFNVLPPFTPDLHTTPVGRMIGDAVRQINSGIAPLVYESRRAGDDVALYYSRPSEHVATAWYAVHGEDEVAQQLCPRLSQFRFFTPALRAAGRSCRAVAYGQVEQGILTEGGIKLLILPFAQAISRGEAEQIREFVRTGGVVLADIRPAVSDQHGCTGEAGLLDDVFGVRHDPDWASYKPREQMIAFSGDGGDPKLELALDPVLLGAPVEIAGARPLGTAGNVPLVMLHEYGDGTAILLNFSLPALGDSRESVAELFDRLLTHCGIAKPLADVVLGEAVGRDGQPIWEVGLADNVRYVSGDIDILGMWFASRRGLGRQQLAIVPPRPGHVYDLRTNRHLGRHDRFDVEIPLEGLAVYAIVPYHIAPPQLDVHADRTGNGNPRLRAVARILPQQAAAQRHVCRLRLYAPDGAEWPDFAVNVLTAAGEARHEIVLPVNAPTGIWQVAAREAISGLETSRDIEIAAATD
jgi:hypothetical protein